MILEILPASFINSDLYFADGEQKEKDDQVAGPSGHRTFRGSFCVTNEGYFEYFERKRIKEQNEKAQEDTNENQTLNNAK